MLRVITRLMLCAALGLGTSIVVAWAFAFGGESNIRWDDSMRVAWVTETRGEVVTFWQSRCSSGMLHLRLMRGPGNAGDTTIAANLGGGLRVGDPPPYRRVPGPPRECNPPTGQANCRSEYQFGWPAHCLWAANDEGAPGGCVVTILGNTHVWRIWPIVLQSAPGAQERRVEDWIAPFHNYPNHQNWYVPNGILPRGLAVNTGAYAVTWWLILLGPGLIRSRRRARLKLCQRCAYPTGTSPVCTECGSPIKGRSEATSSTTRTVPGPVPHLSGSQDQPRACHPAPHLDSNATPGPVR